MTPNPSLPPIVDPGASSGLSEAFPCAVCGWRPSASGVCLSCSDAWRSRWDADSATFHVEQWALGYLNEWRSMDLADRQTFEINLGRGVSDFSSASAQACYHALCLIAASEAYLPSNLKEVA